VDSTLAGSTFGYLHHATLDEAIADLAGHGITEIELTPMPPHLHPPACDAYRRRSLHALLERVGLRCASVNPGFVDLNLISTNPEFRELSLRQLEMGIELAHDLHASRHVVVPGRRHALAPVPASEARGVLLDGLARLLRTAEPLGVEIELENSPYGFLGGADELLAIAEEIDHPQLRLCYDVANALAQEDPADGLRRVAPRLGLVHVSDTWTDRWAHTSVGRGEVDFAAFAVAVADAGYSGPTVYELVDGEDPAPRLADDLRALAGHGWSTASPGAPR
jgi:sugar phosphate isomerase/epimerase